MYRVTKKITIRHGCTPYPQCDCEKMVLHPTLWCGRPACTLLEWRATATPTIELVVGGTGIRSRRLEFREEYNWMRAFRSEFSNLRDIRNMAWSDEAIDCLVARPICGYRREAIPTVEPTALAAMVLMAAGRGREAAAALDWLVGAQSPDGSVGIDADTHQPCWPTGWALLAWKTASQQLPAAKPAWSAAAQRAVAWMLTIRGRPIEENSPVEHFFGHNTRLQGWPWVDGTHSWVEPTAINLLALRSAEQADHSRYREAVELLLDRQLRNGGWNYGNTRVLGHTLRPHVQPTGLALAALADEPNIRPKVQRSLDWLQRSLSDRTTTASLSYAVMGLAACGCPLETADRWLAAACRRTLSRGSSPYGLALLVLAAKFPVGRSS